MGTRDHSQNGIDSLFEGSHSKHQYCKKKRPCTVIDEDQFSSHDIPVEYEPSGIAGTSHPPVASKGADLCGDKDGTYNEEMGEEEIPTGQEIIAERPVEDNLVKDQIKPVVNKGKAVDHVWILLLAM
ncbi:hypothetical protein SCLCIDRAFT_28359 [Scleroderma citrinum Foug A]|uniref:Uncharacterized protein n=1 Tax=Scleroderma citrinum Foug A TaxID=1036808 RepID=A0A0C3DQ13_9AGAM|nr:hypothetical protein SCLCIDRAFT_28359 [Scleroderma citrinum Foug A]